MWIISRILRTYRDIQEGLELVKLEREFQEKTKPILTLELNKYSINECFDVVCRVANCSWYEIGRLTHLLFCRTSRGKMTLEEAIGIYNKENSLRLLRNLII